MWHMRLCGLTAKKPGLAPCPPLVIKYGATFLTFAFILIAHRFYRATACNATHGNSSKKFVVYGRMLSYDTYQPIAYVIIV